MGDLRGARVAGAERLNRDRRKPIGRSARALAVDQSVPAVRAAFAFTPRIDRPDASENLT
jgi:hypothetical protein